MTHLGNMVEQSLKCLAGVNKTWKKPSFYCIKNYLNMKVPILLPNIFNHPFTYESDLNLKVGDFVVVPFGKSKITWVVWDEFEKKIIELLR